MLTRLVIEQTLAELQQLQSQGGGNDGDNDEDDDDEEDDDDDDGLLIAILVIASIMLAGVFVILLLVIKASSVANRFNSGNLFVCFPTHPPFGYDLCEKKRMFRNV